jgi:hypothetical protein
MTTQEPSGTEESSQEISEESSEESSRLPPTRRAPSAFTRVKKRARRIQRAVSRVARDYPTPFFVVTLLGLDALLNVRYPSDEAPLWFFVPSLDVIVLLAALAIAGYLRWKVPVALRIALAAALVFVRLLRLADGVQEHYFSEQFNLYSDLALVPELFRFVHSALPFGLFLLAMLGALLALAGASFGSYYGLLHLERYLRKRRQVYIAAGSLVALYVVSATTGHDHLYDEYFDGALAASVVPRLQHEADFLYNIYSEKGEHAKVMAQAERRLRQLPTNLVKLGKKNVYLIFVESYGSSVFSWDKLAQPSKPVFDRFQADVEQAGFSIVSGTLDSPTYGGRSWLAHSTLATGMRITNQLEYELVCSRRPKVLARFFRDAGYHTVLVQPGTTRAWPKGELYDFEKKYYLWNFDYAGPSYAWATMPDQYVLDFIRKREHVSYPRPLFIQYVLVSSHAPWSDLPPVIENWDAITNGAIYQRANNRHFPITWPNFENAQEAYIQSIIYDFEVLRQYITRWIKDDSLVILLGDHQPVSDVAGNSNSWGVPVHVLSRDQELLKPFEARGYVPGIRPPLEGAHAGLETFLGDFLADFSTWDVQGSLN